MGVDLEDGTWGDCKHGRVRPKGHCQLTSPLTNPTKRKLYAERATSFTSNKELARSKNTEVNQLTNPALKAHSLWSLLRTAANSSGIRAAESSPYTVTDDKHFTTVMGWE